MSVVLVRIIFNRYHEKDKTNIGNVEMRKKEWAGTETVQENRWLRRECSLLQHGS
jgi:hypothetical protein